MNRRSFQQVALMRLADAEVLLRGQRSPGAYYLSGYVIECALKACVAKRFQHEDIPDPALVRDVYTHNLEKLVSLAHLARNLQEQRRMDP